MKKQLFFSLLALNIASLLKAPPQTGTKSAAAAATSQQHDQKPQPPSMDRELSWCSKRVVDVVGCGAYVCLGTFQCLCPKPFDTLAKLVPKPKND